MLRLILVALLTTTLIMGIVLDTSGNEPSDSSTTQQDDREDYGCVHEDHSQYDDGDSLNLNYLNENYSEINGGI